MKLTLLISLAAILAAVPPAQSALVINNSDIAANHYVYTLNYVDTSSSTKFNDDVFSQDQIGVVQEGGGTHFLLPAQNFNFRSTSSFTYQFDFSATDYRPTSLSLTENMTAFASTDPSATITSSYSINNGSTWTVLNSVTSTGSQTGAYGGTSIIDLSGQPASVLFKVDFVANTAGFGWTNAVQWNRLSSDNNNAFNADFTVAVVPEPSSAGLAAAGVLFLLMLYRRRRLV